ncbi:NAD-dependent epimerase/dehydratase family protein [Planococcus halocryophilus]|uniref:NAD-dependent epimerase/dehydratase family protein n=1 Tax=Planococcus halocryophilus TaxID=1215089 RepID=UPI001F0D9F8A|nr:NAD-dependent epimerase/dehydratase family protein [Planococcus halocryophilus]MCH4826791.1 NAD-dependent epimerase/dehydratase family protein [Planococcus halocryophilus]
MRVLVTGENSYAGQQFKKRMSELNCNWKIDFISVRNDEWKSSDFSSYDAIYHVAGIVHKKETNENKNVYYKINRDLTHQLALKAKDEGVKSFVFLSTLAVYGQVGNIEKDVIITKETQPVPNSNYGKSKLEAEELLNRLNSVNFNIVILRIPMVYGPNSPGNYSKLEKMALKISVFPMIENRRSMIHIDKLSNVVKEYIENGVCGLYFPQDANYVNTSEMVKEIAKKNGHYIYLSKFLGDIIKLFGNRIGILNKIFGNLVVEQEEYRKK